MLLFGGEARVTRRSFGEGRAAFPSTIKALVWHVGDTSILSYFDVFTFVQ